jgi:transposase
MFERVCGEHGIEHRLTKPNHPWTNGQVERMNRTLKEATIKRYHYGTHSQLKEHLLAFLMAYNFAKRLKTLRGLTPYEHICKVWTKQPKRFRLNPAASHPGTEHQAIGRSRGGRNTKIHAIADAKGRLLSILLTGGEAHDCPPAQRLIRRAKAARKLLGDRAYDSAELRQWLEDRGTKLVVPNKSNRKQPFSFDRKSYKQRHRIENAFCRLKDFRRIATRYDRRQLPSVTEDVMFVMSAMVVVGTQSACHPA